MTYEVNAEKKNETEVLLPSCMSLIFRDTRTPGGSSISEDIWQSWKNRAFLNTGAKACKASKSTTDLHFHITADKNSAQPLIIMLNWLKGE